MVSVLRNELRSEFISGQFYQEIAFYFENEISYPTEENITRFFRNISETIYYYGLIKNKTKETEDAYHFYNGLNALLKEEEFCPTLTQLTKSPYFEGLKTRLKIILFELLAKCRLNDQALFKETLNELSNFIYNLLYDLGKDKEFARLISNLFILKEFFNKYPHREIELIYIKSLFNASCDLGEAKLYNQIKKLLPALEEVYNRGFGNPESIEPYSNALFNLSGYLGEGGQYKEMKKVLNLLKKLSTLPSSLPCGERVKMIYLDALLNATIHLGRAKSFKELSRVIKEIEGFFALDTKTKAYLCQGLSQCLSLLRKGRTF